MATKPGVTIAPAASISWRPRVDTLPTSAILPPLTATSAVRGAAPVPSYTVPPRITRSGCAIVSSSPHSSRRSRKRAADQTSRQRTGRLVVFEQHFAVHDGGQHPLGDLLQAPTTGGQVVHDLRQPRANALGIEDSDIRRHADAHEATGVQSPCRRGGVRA